MTHTETLHARLTTLGKVPGCYPRKDGVGIYWVEVDYYDPHDCNHDQYLLHDNSALAILCDAARRVLDDNDVAVIRQCSCEGKTTGWGVGCEWSGVIVDSTPTYESALIAGLDWIIEQRGEDA